MTDAPLFQNDQVVYLHDRNSRTGPVRSVVAHVSRQLAYVSYRGREVAFGRIDGREHKSNYGHLHIVSEPDQLAADRANAVKVRLRDHGIVPANNGKFDQPVAVLEQIADLLDQASAA